MSGYEFAQHMPVTALKSTISHVWESFEAHDIEIDVIRACSFALLNIIGDAGFKAWLESVEIEYGELRAYAL